MLALNDGDPLAAIQLSSTARFGHLQHCAPDGHPAAARDRERVGYWVVRTTVLRRHGLGVATGFPELTPFLSGIAASVWNMDAARVQRELELSADEDFILTAWQYRMLQRDIAASKGKHLRSKREVRNSFRTTAIEAIRQRSDDDWSPVVADFEALEDAGPEVSAVVRKRSRALLFLIELYGFEPWVGGKWDKDARAAALSEARQAMHQLHREDLEAVRTA